MGKSYKNKAKLQALFQVTSADVAAQTTLNHDYIATTLFVLPHNDGEAARACQILRAVNAPYLHISRQAWGATLDSEWLRLSIETYDPRKVKNIMIMEMPGVANAPGDPIPLETKLRDLGFRLDIVDHHHYQWVNRFSTESSLEQLCTLIGWQMSADDLAIAINDRSYIPGLKALGLSSEQIRKVRLFDLLCQGNSPNYIEKQFQQARQWLPYLETTKRGKLWILDNRDIKQPYVVQELSLQSPDGLIHAFEIKGHKLGFTGHPNVVDHLLGYDHSKWLTTTGPLLAYAGGDGFSSKYWGLKTVSKNREIPRECADEVLKLITTHLP